MKFLQTLLLEPVIQPHVESSMTRMSGLIILNVTLVLYTSTSHGICLHIFLLGSGEFMVSDMRLSAFKVNSLNCFSFRALKSKIKRPRGVSLPESGDLFRNRRVKQANL